MKAEPQIAIIGAGPAGLAAAIQLTRQGYKPLLFERDEPGGLLRNANWVENYPGFPEGISGPELARLFLDQAKEVGVEITLAEVTLVDLGQAGYVIKTPQAEYEADVVVLASGTAPKIYHEAVLPEPLLDKVHYEVTELASEKGKEAIILGAGDAALDYALNLSRHNEVTILNRSDQVRGLGLLWRRVKQTPSIQYYPDHEVVGVAESGESRLVVTARSHGVERQFEADFLIPAIGRKPAKGFLTKRVNNHLVELTAQGTLYLIGDLANDSFRQTAIAVGDGLRAAMQIERHFTGD